MAPGLFDSLKEATAGLLGGVSEMATSAADQAGLGDLAAQAGDALGGAAAAAGDVAAQAGDAVSGAQGQVTDAAAGVVDTVTGGTQ